MQNNNDKDVFSQESPINQLCMKIFLWEAIQSYMCNFNDKEGFLMEGNDDKNEYFVKFQKLFSLSSCFIEFEFETKHKDIVKIKQRINSLFYDTQSDSFYLNENPEGYNSSLLPRIKTDSIINLYYNGIKFNNAERKRVIEYMKFHTNF